MKIFEDISQISKPFSKAVVTLGNFDGVHKGHIALFKTARKKADEIGGTAIAISFDPHPLLILRPERRPLLITLKDQKIELIRNSGLLDALLILPFSKEFASISANDFIKNFLYETIGMRAMVVGPDYAFGHKREGNIELLKKMGEEMGFELIVPDWVAADDMKERISSTRIRKAVSEGDIKGVVPMLGRFYQIRGIVEAGRQRGGRLLGFPTANIKLQDELCPAQGVYAVTIEGIDKDKRYGVANIGYSPTFDDGIFTVEVHILDFSENIYGSDIKVNFIERLRGEKKFDSIEALSAQIKNDIEKARQIFSQL